MKKYKISMIVLMALSLIFTCVCLVFLDDKIPTHIGINGEPDMFGTKYFMLLFPGVSILIGTIMLLVSKFAKVTDNYSKYLLLTGTILEYVFISINIIFVVFALVYNENQPAFDVSKIIMIVMGTMLILLSNFMPKIEKNRTLGLKTYWSMYNEVTWQKSHRFIGIAGMIAGFLIILSGVFFKDIVNFIILMSLILTVVISSTIASYVYYKQEKNKENNSQN